MVKVGCGSAWLDTERKQDLAQTELAQSTAKTLLWKIWSEVKGVC